MANSDYINRIFKISTAVLEQDFFSTSPMLETFPFIFINNITTESIQFYLVG